jgi:hypothetical protein
MGSRGHSAQERAAVKLDPEGKNGRKKYRCCLSKIASVQPVGDSQNDRLWNQGERKGVIDTLPLGSNQSAVLRIRLPRRSGVSARQLSLNSPGWVVWRVGTAISPDDRS